MGYYSHFILHYATVTTPLTDCLTKGQPNKLCWNENCEMAYDNLHLAFSKMTHLRNPGFTKPFLVHMDVLDTGLGAVLSQEADGQEYPILFLS